MEKDPDGLSVTKATKLVSGDLATPWRANGFGLAFLVFSLLQQVYAARLRFLARSSFHSIRVSSPTV